MKSNRPDTGPVGAETTGTNTARSNPLWIMVAGLACFLGAAAAIMAG
jgi:hypothetical protein